MRTKETPTGKMRLYITRDGKKILQQEWEQYVQSEGKVYHTWKPVPVVYEDKSRGQDRG